MLGVNLTGAFHRIRASMRPMRGVGGGRIVIVGSTAAIQPVVTWSAFCAAMGGLSALVQVAAAELRHDGITVNLLHSSTIDTAAVRAGFTGAEAANFADPAKLGSLMLWLCSGSAIAVPARQPHPTYRWPGLTE
jgi:NAD(P)-dependent dehydrogenase (short-subunit alcohol dehydrogenase family)